MTTRRLAPALLGGLTAVALSGGAAWYLNDNEVTLSVDGVDRQVSTRGDTVADVLAAAGEKAGEHDVVAPAVGTPVESGDTVALRRGRPVDLTVDGKQRTVWVTAASVDEALEQIGVRDRDVALSASRSRAIPVSGLALSVTTPKDISILVDGQVKPVTTTAPSVRAALVDAGVVLRPADKLSARREAVLTDRQVLRVTRIDGKRVTEVLPVPYQTVRRADPDTYRGETTVLTDGRAGTLERVYTVNYEDGRQKSKFLGSQRLVIEPVDRVVAVGTKTRPVIVDAPPLSALRAGGGPNFAALARCESTGDPRAASPNGLYYGLYQFDFHTWQSVGGSGNPADASPSEQTMRAQRLYDQRGKAPWPVCGRHL